MRGERNFSMALLGRGGAYPVSRALGSVSADKQSSELLGLMNFELFSPKINEKRGVPALTVCCACS